MRHAPVTRPIAVRALLGLALALLAAGCERVTQPRIIGDILVVSGDNQSAKAGTELANPLVVKVIDDMARAVPGVRVDWAVVIGNGTLSASQTVTGTDGQTSVRAAPTVGGQSAVTATIAEDLMGLYQVTFVMEGTL